ncbi:MAG: AAA family ATPase [Sulfobacillus sp.]
MQRTDLREDESSFTITDRRILNNVSAYIAQKLANNGSYQIIYDDDNDHINFGLNTGTTIPNNYKFDYMDAKVEASLSKHDKQDILTLFVRCDRARAKEVVMELVTESNEFRKNIMSSVINTNIADYKGNWNIRHKLPKRSLDTIYLPDKDLNRIKDDLIRFYNNEAVYAKYAIPYKRTYLFFGPPGTGKTSLIKALASEFNKTIGIINLSYYFNNESLIHCIQHFDSDFLILEDFDQMLHNSMMSFSNIVSFIDGLLSRPGMVIFLSTNHLDKIGDIITRPGRVDMFLCFDYLTDETLKKMFERFFPKQMNNFEKFRSNVPKKLTHAKLENFFFAHLDTDDICKYQQELYKNELDEGKIATLKHKYDSYDAIFT